MQMHCRMYNNAVTHSITPAQDKQLETDETHNNKTKNKKKIQWNWFELTDQKKQLNNLLLSSGTKLYLWLAAALHTSIMAFFQIFCAWTASWSSPHVELTQRKKREEVGAEWREDCPEQAEGIRDKSIYS